MAAIYIYILPAKERRLLGKFSDGQPDMARSTRLVMLIKNIYTLWGRKSLLHCVATIEFDEACILIFCNISGSL